MSNPGFIPCVYFSVAYNICIYLFIQHSCSENDENKLDVWSICFTLLSVCSLIMINHWPDSSVSCARYSRDVSKIRLPQIAQSPCKMPLLAFNVTHLTQRNPPSYTRISDIEWHYSAAQIATVFSQLSLKYILKIDIWILTLQSMHLFPYGLMLPFFDPCPGLV